MNISRRSIGWCFFEGRHKIAGQAHGKPCELRWQKFAIRNRQGNLGNAAGNVHACRCSQTCFRIKFDTRPNKKTSRLSDHRESKQNPDVIYLKQMKRLESKQDRK